MHDNDENENDRLIRHLCHENVTGLVYVVGKWKEAEKRCNELEKENRRLTKLLEGDEVDTSASKSKWYRRFWKS